MKLNLLDKSLFDDATFEAGENLGRAESDRAILMVAYSRRVLENAKCIDADGNPSAAMFSVARLNGELKRAKAAVGGQCIPGDGRTWDQRFGSDCRIVGLYGAICAGLLPGFKPDDNGDLTLESSLTLRKAWQAAKADQWKMVSGRPAAEKPDATGVSGGGGGNEAGTGANGNWSGLPPGASAEDKARVIRMALRDMAELVDEWTLAECFGDVFSSDFLIKCAAVAERNENAVIIDAEVVVDVPAPVGELTAESAAL